MTENIVIEEFLIDKHKRREKNGHHSFVIWFTGLSGSGKSTLAKHFEKKMHERGLNTYPLDGDNVRHGLNKDLGFSAQDREENIRRIAEVAKLMVDAGVIVTSSFISPYRKERDFARSIVDSNEFIEVHVNAPLDVCENRDVKGLYKKAREGVIKNFTGISDPYEEPLNPDLKIDTHEMTIDESVDKIIDFLVEKELI